MKHRVVAYYPVHYGREWFHWSLKSVVNFVDEILVVYVKQPSYGQRTGMTCPETEEELREIAKPFGVTWLSMNSFQWEGQHRDYAAKYCTESMGANIILPMDCDEIWEPDHLSEVLEEVDSTLFTASRVKDWRIPMQHYWRSVEWICRDPLQPVRVVVPSGQGEVYWPFRENGYMHHFGYAQSPLLVNYKWHIHGHQAELRPGWFEDIFMGWPEAKFDVHPTNLDFWTPAFYGKERIAHLIGDHPYFDMDVIDNTYVNEGEPLFDVHTPEEFNP